MIYESQYWKKQLIKSAAKINRRMTTKRIWTVEQIGGFEQEVMIGFYMIRKLMDAKKLTNIICSTKIEGEKYMNNGRTVTLLNNHNPDKLYNLNTPFVQKFDLKFLINQIVHSYLFYPDFEEMSDGIYALDKLYFTSDDNRNKFLYSIKISDIINLFVKVGECVVLSISYEFNNNKNDYDVKSS